MSDSPDTTDPRNSSATTAVPFATSVDSAGPASGILFGMSPPSGLDHTFYFPSDGAHSMRLPLALAHHHQTADEISANTTDNDDVARPRCVSNGPLRPVRVVGAVQQDERRETEGGEVSPVSPGGVAPEESQEVLSTAMRSLVLHDNDSVDGGGGSASAAANVVLTTQSAPATRLPPTYPSLSNASPRKTSGVFDSAVPPAPQRFQASGSTSQLPPPPPPVVPPLGNSTRVPPKSQPSSSEAASSFSRVTGPPPGRSSSTSTSINDPVPPPAPVQVPRDARESQSQSPVARPASAGLPRGRPATSASGQFHASSASLVRRTNSDEVFPDRLRSSTSMSAGGLGPTSAGAISAYHGYLNRSTAVQQGTTGGGSSGHQPQRHDSGGSSYFDPLMGARRSASFSSGSATYPPDVVMHPHSVVYSPQGTAVGANDAPPFPARQGWRYDHSSAYASRPSPNAAAQWAFSYDGFAPSPSVPASGAPPGQQPNGWGFGNDGRSTFGEQQCEGLLADRQEDSASTPFGRPMSPRAAVGAPHRHRHVRASPSSRHAAGDVSPQLSDHGSEGLGLMSVSSLSGAAGGGGVAAVTNGSVSPSGVVLGGGGGSSAWEVKSDIASPGSNGGSVAAPVLQRSAAETVQRKKEEKAEMVNVDEDEFLEKQRRNAAVSSAMHSIPWLQRKVEPNIAFGNDKCGMCVAPRFWERMDWTLRATFLAVLPATILSLDPATTGYFVLPSTVASFAYWISAPTLGGGLREFFIVLKGSIIALAMLSVVLAVQPTSQGVFVFLYFLQILVVAFVAESVKKTSAWCVSVFMLQLYSAPDQTNYAFVRDFFVAVLIGCGFGLVAFLIPRVNWSHILAQSCCTAYGSSLSIAIQGVVHSFWCRSEMEREYQLIRIKQLLQVCHQCQETFQLRFSEAEFEPHTGLTLAKLKYRANMLDDITRVVQCLLQLVENVDVKPDILDSPLLRPFGERLEPALNVLASAMDSTLLKICDFKHPIYFADLQLFLRVRMDFQEQLSQIRQELILSNDDYRTDESDIFLGAYLFCVDELAERIGTFTEPTSAPSRIAQAARAPIDDLFSAVDTVKYFLKILLTQGSLIRRAKEAIKLALSMTLPLLIQVFLLNPQDATPVAGPSIIAWVYQRTGAESFSYASNRVLGTVIGSLTALIAVQLAAGRLWLMYVFLGFLALCGNFVQTSKNYNQAGNALVFSVISIISQYKDQSAAIGRIQQNVFAILIYFAISYIAWPVRAIEKLSLEFDTAVRSYREAMFKLLGSMDSSVSAILETCNDVDEHWRDSAKHISRQASLVPAAVKEPTMIGAAFPEQPWLKLVQSQKNLSYLSWMMQFAFRTFERSNCMSCGGGGGDSNQTMTDVKEENSLHWIVVRRLAPQARLVAELIYAACDLYLLSMSHAEMVPVQHLVRLRVAMVEEYRRIVDTYCNTLILRLQQSDDVEDAFAKTFRRPLGRGVDGAAASMLSANKASPRISQQKEDATPSKLPLQPADSARKEKVLDATDRELLEMQPSRPSALGSDGEPLTKNTPSATLSPKHTLLGEKLLPRPEPITGLAGSPPPSAAAATADAAKSPTSQQQPQKPPGASADRGGAKESAEQPPPSPIVDVALHDELDGGATNGDEGDDDLRSASVTSANFVLRNRDIHSLEAFLFGMRASVVEIGEFQKAMLEVQNAIEIVHRL